MPRSNEQWKVIQDDFESTTGIPNINGAIDGSLYAIQRPKDPEGWYCRKGFPAFNVQAVVDNRRRFMSYSITPGSQNDQGIFNKSKFGKGIQLKIPAGKYSFNNSELDSFFLADAGYKLQPHIMTPYAINSNTTREESRYNYHHSSARMTVECTFGILKSVFRIFKRELNHSTPEAQADVIVAAMVLHNWRIEINEEIVAIDDDYVVEQDANAFDGDAAEGLEAGRVRRNVLKEFINTELI